LLNPSKKKRENFLLKKWKIFSSLYFKLQQEKEGGAGMSG